MKIRGKCKWACVTKPNTAFEPCWSIDIVINEEKAAELSKLGVKTKKDKDGDLVLKLKRKVTKADGSENTPPICRDRNNEPFNKLIGNGSEVIALFSTYEWSNKFGSGTGVDFRGVQVVEHIPYGDGEDFEPLDDDEGFSTVKAPPKSKKTTDFDDDVPDFL